MNFYVGIDVGNLFLKFVVILNDEIKEKKFIRHNSLPWEIIKNLLEEFKNQKIKLGLTGSIGVLRELGEYYVNPTKAIITGVTRFKKDVFNVIDIGARQISLLRFNAKKELVDFKTNSICAAGTGSFLDQQMIRLELDYPMVEKFSYLSNPPSIATRCAVFAKTDLIHRQQEGYTKEELWNGLIKSTSETILSTLLKGECLEGKTVLIGGGSLHKKLLKWLGNNIETFPEAVFTQAIGAALHGKDLKTKFAFLRKPFKKNNYKNRRLPLLIKKSIYPKFNQYESIDAYGNEVVEEDSDTKTKEVYMGIDIGSTSTKLFVMNPSGKLLYGLYRRTAGDPLQATKLLFKGLREIENKRERKFKFLGVATTGSGRKFVGKVIGADLIINEITAHARGALETLPDTETIFEIGGQDSKFIRVKNGKVIDCNLNFVCAAGTGSFIEEQAQRLGINVKRIGDIVRGIAPPFTSERCTVFMEQDIEKLLEDGISPAEAMAATLYSVAKNYLTKVVSGKPISKEKIVFQGATAKNEGLVAAFENLLDTKLIVSPYCHVMGAWGAALLVKERVKKDSSFKGLSVLEKDIQIKKAHCNLCSNHCKITYVLIEREEEVPSFGYMCGREPDSRTKKESFYFKPFQEYQNIFLKSE